MSINEQLSIDDALTQILKDIKLCPIEEVSLEDSYGRVLGEDIFAPFSIPPLNNSAMDGYVFSYKDLQNQSVPVTFPVMGEIPAGSLFEGTLEQGKVLKIMTGAIIPEGCDTVIPFEMTTEKGDSVTFNETVTKSMNIRFKGEDVLSGDLILRKGLKLRPQDTGMIASFGFNAVKVYKRPLVGIMATGDEIVEAGEKRKEGQIYNINSYTLAGQIRQMGGEAVILGIASDSKEKLTGMIEEGIKRNVDILISSGGISAGNFDYVRDVLAEAGSILFRQVKMRPGKPFSYGKIGNTFFFGLPGNPVASMVSTEIFVKPLIKKMCGESQYKPFYINAYSLEDVKKKKGFTYILRVKLKMEKNTHYAWLTGSQGSGILKSMVDADGFAIIPEEQGSIKKGDLLRVLPFAGLYK